MKKKIPLMVNEPFKNELELSANVILEKISMIQKLSKKNLNIDLDKPQDAIAFIKRYTRENDIDNIEKQNELLFVKFDSEVSKLMADYTNLIETKALEMFSTPSDREQAKQTIRLAVSINFSVKKLSHTIDLEHFILNDEFTFNSKIDTRLKDIYTVFCKNNKQVELMKLAEKLSDIVKHSIKIDLVSDKAIGVNVENIININTGKILSNKIAMIQ